VIVEQGATREVTQNPKHTYTQKLLNSRPQRDVSTPGEGCVVQAHKVSVDYPTRLPGIRGWFRHGRFNAVREVDFDLAPGETDTKVIVERLVKVLKRW